MVAFVALLGTLVIGPFDTLPLEWNAMTEATQPCECRTCKNSFFFYEHDHDEGGSYYDNLQCHIGGPYPYYCEPDHGPCSVHDELLGLARSIDGLYDGPATGEEERKATLRRLLIERRATGIEAEVFSHQVHLRGRCSETGQEFELRVPLPS